MAIRRKKDYSGGANLPVDINDYRRAPWLQMYMGVSIDFRRWVYVSRPELNEDGTGENCVHANRDMLVQAFRNAVWEKNATEKSKLNYCGAGANFFFQYLDWLFENGEQVADLSDISERLIEDYISWLKNTYRADTSSASALTLSWSSKAPEKSACIRRPTRRQLASISGVTTK